ncbi:MAG: KH domain-containing protein [Actinobacteria bacterium]|jgi:predicted RNA-binding protein YlqC (UPF0109 family)|nr:KH domain-containing protein [Actinomycetota bacterium]MCL6095029.1 KH domain-containing protein [Actinomycetota bacterium]
MDIEADVDDMEGNRAVAAISKSVLDYLVSQIVTDPEAVVIETKEESPESVLFRLHVAPEDMGRVIGRHGRVAQAIRTILRVAGDREGVKVSLDIVNE